MSYELNLWKRPDHYMGETWENYYVFLSQNRDSDTLDRSNFECGLKAIGGEKGETVIVVREGHWACGWIEWVAIKKTAKKTLEKAEKIINELNDYPIINEEHHSELEYEECQKIWEDCFSPIDRIEYLRDNGVNQYCNFKDLLSCVRKGDSIYPIENYSSLLN